MLEVILVTFPGFAKNAAPHELVVKTNQIEGRVPVKASQKASSNEEKKRDENEDETIMDFGDILGSFWEAFGSILDPKAVRNSVSFSGSFFLRFLYATRLRRDFGGTLAQVCAPRSPPGRHPFRARRNHIKT